MKYVKLGSLAVPAAIAFTALIGLGAASAAGVLCEEAVDSGCKTKVAVGSGLSFSLKKSTSGLARDTNGFQIDTCTETAVGGSVTNSGSGTANASAKVETLALTGCSESSKTLTTFGTLSIENISGTTTGRVMATGTVVTVFNTLLGVTCNYTAGAGISLGTYTPGAEGLNGILSVAAVIKRTTEHSGSAFCPETMNWTAEYAQTSLTPIRSIAAS